MTNEELALLAKDGDEEAIQSLLLKNEGIIASIAKRYGRIGVDTEDDLKNIGRYVIWKSLHVYDHEKTKFTTFINSVMTNALNQLYRKTITKKRSAVLECIDEIVTNKGDGLTLHEIIPDEDSTNWIDQWENNELLYESLEVFMKMADSTEKGIIEARIIYQYPLQEIADYLGVSRETVRKTEIECLECMQHIANSLMEWNRGHIEPRKGEVYHIDHVVA